MTLDDMLPNLLSLNRAEKLRAIQLLAHELAVETGTELKPTAQYEIWSPYDSAVTAREMQELLDNEQQPPHA